jgi:hypothetical protein
MVNSVRKFSDGFFSAGACNFAKNAAQAKSGAPQALAAYSQAVSHTKGVDRWGALKLGESAKRWGGGWGGEGGHGRIGRGGGGWRGKGDGWKWLGVVYLTMVQYIGNHLHDLQCMSPR